MVMRHQMKRFIMARKIQTLFRGYVFRKVLVGPYETPADLQSAGGAGALVAGGRSSREETEIDVGGPPSDAEQKIAAMQRPRTLDPIRGGAGSPTSAAIGSPALPAIGSPAPSHVVVGNYG